MAAFALFAAPLGRHAAGVALAAWLGLLFGTGKYCSGRARQDLSEEWLEEQRNAPVPKWWSFWPDDYRSLGQRWVKRFWIVTIAMILSWLFAGVVGMKRGTLH